MQCCWTQRQAAEDVQKRASVSTCLFKSGAAKAAWFPTALCAESELPQQFSRVSPCCFSKFCNCLVSMASMGAEHLNALRSLTWKLDPASEVTWESYFLWNIFPIFFLLFCISSKSRIYDTEVNFFSHWNWKQTFLWLLTMLEFILRALSNQIRNRLEGWQVCFIDLQCCHMCQKGNINLCAKWLTKNADLHCAQVNPSLYLYITYHWDCTRSRDGCSCSSTGTYFTSWKKRSWKKIRALIYSTLHL